MDPDPELHRRPVSITLRLQGPEVLVEISLVLGFAGEDYVHTSLNTAVGARDFGPTVAHKGKEMTKALKEHADSVREALADAR